MSDRYRLLGAENSPYSVKVRSFLRYRQVPHDWVLRSQAQDEFQRLARLPLVPLLVTPEGEGLQDSTPILESLDARLPGPSIHPPDAAPAFLSALLEEYGDEWGNKWMFHFRWARELDQLAASRRLVDDMMPGVDPAQAPRLAAGIRERMVPRVSFVGSNETTAPLIETSFVDALDLIEAHLGARAYLFGARPALADFGLAAEFYELSLDPTPASALAGRPRVLAWCRRMLDPRDEGPFEALETLLPTLEPWLRREVAGRFLPWSDANAHALTGGHESFTVELEGGVWTQAPQKYHARSLSVLRQRFSALDAGQRSVLEPILQRSGCLRWLE
ncbi:MAG: glutathione S-transferase family protein [Pseudomonadales bacterium]|jgi:glutathione S-transferase|nr:glutathione S-transferase family protein [Pseudomonadales bacterium]